MTTPQTGPGSANRTAFPTTPWSVVLAAGRERSPEGDAALETLAQAYWYPICAFLRREGYAAAEAQDLTQAFFARLLEENYPAQADARPPSAAHLREGTALEGDSLAFAQLIEPRATAGRLVKQILAAVIRRNETESLVRQPLDRAVHRRHCRLAVERQLNVAWSSCSPGIVRSGIGFPGYSRRHA